MIHKGFFNAHDSFFYWVYNRQVDILIFNYLNYMGIEGFPGAKDTSVNNNNEANAVKRKSVEIIDGMVLEKFSDGTYMSNPIKGLQPGGKERVSVEINNSEPGNIMVLEKFSDGTYQMNPVDKYK